MTCQPKYDAQTQEFIDLYLASSPERKHIMSTLITLLSLYKGNRDAQGRFRKMPSVGEQFREYLLMFKKLPEFQSDAYEVEIELHLRRCDEIDAEAAQKDGAQ